MGIAAPKGGRRPRQAPPPRRPRPLRPRRGPRGSVRGARAPAAALPAPAAARTALSALPSGPARSRCGPPGAAGGAGAAGAASHLARGGGSGPRACPAVRTRRGGCARPLAEHGARRKPRPAPPLTGPEGAGPGRNSGTGTAGPGQRERGRAGTGTAGPGLGRDRDHTEAHRPCQTRVPRGTAPGPSACPGEPRASPTVTGAAPPVLTAFGLHPGSSRAALQEDPAGYSGMNSVLTRCYPEDLVSEVTFICYLELFADNLCSPAAQCRSAGRAPGETQHFCGSNPEATHTEIRGSIVRPLSPCSRRDFSALLGGVFVAFSASDTRWRWKSPFPAELRPLDCSLTTRVCVPAWKDEIFLFNPK
ncbi:uncharacterized protein LOC106629650 [Zonotrichia albicollis]|uniref:uncharacterized protein LOC106629650 n=1 Tax=Zonotrichia albicollis TaxID=44394 RepID=UPI003D80D4BC